MQIAESLKQFKLKIFKQLAETDCEKPKAQKL